jgi:hypothetical protein
MKAMSKKAISKAMSAEPKPIHDPPKNRPQRAAYGLCDHRRLSLPAGVVRDRSQGGAGGAIKVYDISSQKPVVLISRRAEAPQPPIMGESERSQKRPLLILLPHYWGPGGLLS